MVNMDELKKIQVQRVQKQNERICRKINADDNTFLEFLGLKPTKSK